MSPNGAKKAIAKSAGTKKAFAKSAGAKKAMPKQSHPHRCAKMYPNLYSKLRLNVIYCLVILPVKKVRHHNRKSIKSLRQYIRMGLNHPLNRERQRQLILLTD